MEFLSASSVYSCSSDYNLIIKAYTAEDQILAAADEVHDGGKNVCLIAAYYITQKNVFTHSQ